MTRLEFEQLLQGAESTDDLPIKGTVSPEDYAAIETAYMAYEDMTKATAVALYKECGLRPFQLLALDAMQAEFRSLLEEEDKIDKQLKTLDEEMEKLADAIAAGR